MVAESEVPGGQAGDALADEAIDRERAHGEALSEQVADERPREFGGRKGPEPTRYGDWEKNGRCIDF